MSATDQNTPVTTWRGVKKNLKLASMKPVQKVCGLKSKPFPKTWTPCVTRMPTFLKCDSYYSARLTVAQFARLVCREILVFAVVVSMSYCFNVCFVPVCFLRVFSLFFPGEYVCGHILRIPSSFRTY